ncbi:YhcN/YlaJ family sporulation lipoprotein [Fictibacillus barbaricus]|uniref:YhcN/YlaJ family sporulation lipoprotein n=1 Tax=Fictibacillus barbaricus TaxID=182136 RepID=A0ABS2ZIC1_9BACL|nr:YhcN/YlaJ family sporulation lipoprotein [Fictibacillus barbaricus]MBN3547078.1 YhcN/YlaJ family sporulation lipoprotein [Fictibacillus barbaricus]GGB46265.1 putative lipoprotein YutC [Fictibacillus barbaricus]
MKKLGILLMISIMLSGCGGDDQKKMGQEYKFSKTNVKDENRIGDNTNYGDFGYMRHMSGDKVKSGNGVPYLNRQKLADMISDMVLQLPNIKDVGTLVTDEEVLIGYKTTNKDRNAAADQVKMTAFAVVPRYYHVYVSDEKGMIDKIEQYQSLNNDTEEIEGIMDRLIQEMKKAPQGKKWNYGENENGEMNGETNPMRSKMEGK